MQVAANTVVAVLIGIVVVIRHHHRRHRRRPCHHHHHRRFVVMGAAADDAVALLWGLGAEAHLGTVKTLGVAHGFIRCEEIFRQHRQEVMLSAEEPDYNRLKEGMQVPQRLNQRASCHA